MCRAGQIQRGPRIQAPPSVHLANRLRTICICSSNSNSTINSSSSNSSCNQTGASSLCMRAVSMTGTSCRMGWFQAFGQQYPRPVLVRCSKRHWMIRCTSLFSGCPLNTSEVLIHCIPVLYLQYMRNKFAAQVYPCSSRTTAVAPPQSLISKVPFKTSSSSDCLPD